MVNIKVEVMFYNKFAIMRKITGETAYDNCSCYKSDCGCEEYFQSEEKTWLSILMKPESSKSGKKYTYTNATIAVNAFLSITKHQEKLC